MARKVNRLTAVEVRKISKPGMHPDGAGLYLRVHESGARGWIFRYRNRECGLGTFPDVGLQDARETAATCRKLLLEGKDPIEYRRAHKAAIVVVRVTFAEAAAAYIAAKAPEWRSDKTLARWQRLTRYISETIGALDVAAVDTQAVRETLKPYWLKSPETAGKMREAIEAILDAAAAAGHRPRADNPARWRGHLSFLLPSHAKAAPVEHHPALTWQQAPDFYRFLEKHEAPAAMAYRLLILTATRTSEALGMRWEEVEGDTWSIPPERTKPGRLHRVPMSAPVRELLQTMKAFGRGDFVFPGQRDGRPLSNMALLMLLRRAGRTDHVPHGWRSTFRTWASEVASYPWELCEAALGHAVGDSVERSYQRGDLFERRRQLMDDWSSYVCGSNCKSLR
jgi:integrase